MYYRRWDLRGLQSYKVLNKKVHMEFKINVFFLNSLVYGLLFKKKVQEKTKSG